MAVKFGSARIDEKGNAVGGAAGDQTGKEVMVEPYYAHPLGWKCYRAKDPNVANALATAMVQACNNNHIGYDQNARLGVITQLAKYGSLAKIAVDCECDCSSLVRACCIQAGIDVANFTTYNEGKFLEDTGKFEAGFVVNDISSLCVGDILVTCKKGHTGIIVEGKARTTAKKSVSEIADEVIAGKWGNSPDRKKNLEAAGYNYAEVQKAVNAKLKSGTPSKTPKWVGVVTGCTMLNVRTSPEKISNNIYQAYPQLACGNKVDVCDQKDGWDYIRFMDVKKNYHYAWVSGEFIAKV